MVIEDNKRYNEKEIVKRFLVSEQGVTFLINHARRDRKIRHSAKPDKKAIRDQVNNIIDYYLAWVNKFPVRRSMRVSRYEFLRHLEEFCSKNNILDLFDFLFT